ncbi:hypothetical protein D3C81_1737180 [compost metagenome]
MAALGVPVAAERIGRFAGDALADQRVHVGEGAGTEAGLALSVHQQAVKFAAGDDAQAQVKPGLGALFDVTDYLHLQPPQP